MDIEKIHSLFIESTGLTTDSRKITNGQLFFALKGDNFNGNKYAAKALESGASYAVIDEVEFEHNENFIVVEDVLTCLQELAKFHRRYLNIPILAITGTNGKTTTKELISTVLLKKFKLGFTQGNLNNHIGVPLTLLSFSKDTEIGVVELGANHIGEIAELCKIAAPDFGLITNIGKAHIEGFGSFEGIIKTKSELYDYLRANDGQIFINGDDELLIKQSSGLKRRTYGNSENLDVKAKFIGTGLFLKLEWNKNHITTNLVGAYNFNNVLAAICVGSFFGVEEEKIIEALSSYKPTNNRSQLKKTGKNTLIIDTYNANPSSMDLAIKNFFNVKDENKALILGDMFELGDFSHEEHEKIIKLVKKLKFNAVFFVGRHFFNFKESFSEFDFFIDNPTLCKYLNTCKLNNKTILLKASRGIKLEEVIDYL